MLSALYCCSRKRARPVELSSVPAIPSSSASLVSLAPEGSPSSASLVLEIGELQKQAAASRAAEALAAEKLGQLQEQLAAEKRARAEGEAAGGAKLAAVEKLVRQLAYLSPILTIARRLDVPFQWCETVAKMGRAFTLENSLHATPHHDKLGIAKRI